VEGSGGVVTSWSSGQAATIRAAHLHLVLEKEEGQLVEGPGGDLYRQPSSRSREHRNFTNVTLRVLHDEQTSQLLTIPTNTSANFSARGFGSSSQEIVPPGRLLAGGGYSDRRQSAGNQESLPAFNYRTPTAMISHVGLDGASLSGDFRLFANNATLEFETETGSGWSTWTGYHQTSNMGPSSEYAIRVATVDVSGGSLTVDVPDATHVLARNLDTTVNGSVEMPAASGTLSIRGERVNLSNAELRLSGEGQTEARLLSTSGASEPPPSLSISVRGEFRAMSEPRIADPAESPDGFPAGETPWVTGMLAGVAAAGLLLVVVVRTRLARRLPETVRKRLYRRWKREAIELEDDRRFMKAARRYRRLTRLFPNRVRGWYGFSLCLLEADRSEEAKAASVEARDELDAVPIELLQVQTASAYESGDLRTAEEAWTALRDRSPELAHELHQAIGLDDLDGPFGTTGRFESTDDNWGVPR